MRRKFFSNSALFALMALFKTGLDKAYASLLAGNEMQRPISHAQITRDGHGRVYVVCAKHASAGPLSRNREHLSGSTRIRSWFRIYFPQAAESRPQLLAGGAYVLL